MKISDCLLFVSTSWGLWSVVHSDECYDHVYGPGCKYLCHCSGNKCKDSYATCESGYSCANGYFGPACSYRDSIKTTAYKVTVPNLIADLDDSTCLAAGTISLTMDFEDPTDFTWMRVKTQPAATTIDVSFNSGILCTNKRLYMGGITTDITCDLVTTFTAMKVEIPVSNQICTIYLSRGRNIALGQATNQTEAYNNHFISSLAVDGNYNMTIDYCTQTDTNINSRWSVFFDHPSILVLAYITNRDKLQNRLKNFVLSTYNIQNTLVQQIAGPNYEKDEYRVVFKKGQDITTYIKWLSILQPSDVLTICEILIYGDYMCPDDTWSLDCSETCNCKIGQSCFWITGVCGSGCAVGKYGFNCSLSCPNNCLNNICKYRYGDCYGCKLGYFGARCETDCSPYCLGGICDHYLGTCRDCKHGFYGVKCTMNCPTNCPNCTQYTGLCDTCVGGFYGDYCDKVCSNNCLNGSCNATNGWCVGCIDGYYGLGCADICPVNCYLQRCHQFTGDCLVCEPGFFGNKCNNSCSQICRTCTSNSTDCSSCPIGFHGTACDIPCAPNCYQGICNILNGTCDSCKYDYYGPSCSNRCPDFCINKTCHQHNGTCFSCRQGKYGLTCSNTCSATCTNQSCDVVTGLCFNCTHGFFDDTCSTKCSPQCEKTGCLRKTGLCLTCSEGFYGTKCERQCSEHCNENKCNAVNGTCHACKDLRYGFLCEYQCSLKCLGSYCNRLDGSCVSCEEGYYSKYCNVECPDNCKNNKCDFEGGYCTDGAMIIEDTKLPGFIYFLLLLPFVFLLCCAMIIVKGDCNGGELM